MTNNNELKHSGVKGMKWGVRRYQNKDGTLTPLGKKRYDYDTREMSDKKKAKYTADPDKWVKDDLQSGRRLADESANLTNKLKNINDAGARKHKKANIDLSNMTDQQMRNEINRALLERQYTDMFAPQKVSRGRKAVGKTLEVAGNVLMLGSSALGIALAIKELKK